MNQIKKTKEDVISHKEELERLLSSGEGSLEFLNFLERNIQLVEDHLNNIEARGYAPFVRLAYENPIIFQYLAVQRQNLLASRKRYETFEDEQNASQIEKIREDRIQKRWSAIDRELDELAEPLKDNALAILLKVTKAVHDYKTNSIGITFKEELIGNSHNADIVDLQLDGFKEAYLWFHWSNAVPQFSATDENGNKIHMRVTDDFYCEIANEDSCRDHTSGWIGSHLWNPGGYEKISQILSNLGNAVHNLAVQRNPEIANETPLTFEQIEIAKTNIFKYYPLSNHGLSEEEKQLVYKK